MSIKNKQIPIIVYCYNKKCNAAEKVIHKLKESKEVVQIM